MPYSARRIQQLAKRLASQQPAIRSAELKERSQHVTSQFRAARLQFRLLHAQYRALQLECAWLRQVVNAKQRLIEKLLPYYPHSLTPDILRTIEMY